MLIKSLDHLITVKAGEKYLTGAAWVNNMVDHTLIDCDISSITFEEGARTHWHTHPTTQVLIVMQGVGYVQKKGEPRVLIRPGDVVIIYPHEEHWHGATPASLFSHLAIQLLKDEASLIQPVSQQEYNQRGKE